MINQASVVHRLPSDPQTTLLSFNLDLQLFILILRVLISKSIPVNFGRKCDICAKYIFVRWEQNVTSDVDIFFMGTKCNICAKFIFLVGTKCDI